MNRLRRRRNVEHTTAATQRGAVWEKKGSTLPLSFWWRDTSSRTHIYPICRPFSPHRWWPLLPPFAAPEAALSKIERKIVPTQPREREREASFVRAMNFSSSLSSVP